MRKINPALHDRLAKLIESMGYELVGCESLAQGRQTLLRIYLDGREQKGVTVEDCSLVSRQISAMMDVEEPFQGRYVLEVSSPGIDRPLFELEHYRRFAGKTIKVRLQAAIDNRRSYKGVLQRVEGDTIYMLVEDSGQELKVPFSTIEKGNIIGEVGFQKLDARNQEPEN